MAWTKYQLSLVATMFITGSIGTLITKWVDMMDAVNSAGVAVPFNHPFVQSITMFIGEVFCLIAFDAVVHYRRNKDLNLSAWTADKHSLLVYYPSALLDMLSSCIMYMGLGMTYASSYQILRGSVIIFTGILSVLLLKKKLPASAWIGMLFMMVGLIIVGLTDFLFTEDGSSNEPTEWPMTSTMEYAGPTKLAPLKETEYTVSGIVTGDILIVVAQVITAFQLVYQEKYYTKHHIPALQAVGFEGVFGFFTLSLLMIPFYYIPVPESMSGNPRNVLEDVLDAFVQMGNSGLTLIGLIISIFSLSFFNFSGVSVTKELSATTRMVIDSTRTVVVWLASLALSWQPFYWPHVIGFTVLIIGTCIYNKIIPLPFCNSNSSNVQTTDLLAAGNDNPALEEAKD